MQYRREIDGLRALAVLPVILFHAGFTLFHGGYVGVDVFFVLSGYLITTIILADLQQGRFSLLHFYERRARRILPALFFVMTACLPLAWLWLSPTDLLDFSQSVLAVVTFSSNILFWQQSDYFSSAAELKPLLHTWSLAVEEQYYVLTPLLMMLLWRQARRWLAAVLLLALLASLALAHWGSLHKPVAAFFVLPTRAWELLVGALVAMGLQRPAWQRLPNALLQAGAALGLAMLSASVFLFDRHTAFPGLPALLPTLGTALMVVCARPSTVVGRLLGHRVLVGVGLISYSAYLWHQPLLAFARHWSLVTPPTWLMGALAAFSLVLAYGTWRWVESPFRQAQRFSRRQVFTLAALASGVFCAVGLVGWASGGLPQRFGPDMQAALFAAHDVNPRRQACLHGGDAFPAPAQDCVLGDPAHLVGALLGDSHASTFSEPLQQRLSAAGLGLLSLTYNGCPPALDLQVIDAARSNRCQRFNQQAFEHIVADPALHTVVLVARWSFYAQGTNFDNGEGGREEGPTLSAVPLQDGQPLRLDEAARQAQVIQRYTDTVRRYLAAGKQVVLVYPVPEVGVHVPNAMIKAIREHGPTATAAPTTAYARFLERQSAVLSAFDRLPEHERLVRVRPAELLCNSAVSGRCVTQLGTEVLYHDDDHLSNRGATRVLDRFIGELKSPH